jgi:hypothetical protein
MVRLITGEQECNNQSLTSGRIGGQDESDGPAGVYAVVLSAFLVDFTNDLSATLSTNPWPRPTFHGTIALRGR